MRTSCVAAVGETAQAASRKAVLPGLEGRAARRATAAAMAMHLPAPPPRFLHACPSLRASSAAAFPTPVMRTTPARLLQLGQGGAGL